MSRAALLALPLTLAALTLAGVARAQDAPPPPPPSDQAPPPPTDQGPPREGGRRGGPMRMVREACAADMQTYCADAGADRRAGHQCMMAHQSQLSGQCKDAVAKMEAWRQSHPRRGGPGGPPQDGPQPQGPQQ